MVLESKCMASYFGISRLLRAARATADPFGAQSALVALNVGIADTGKQMEAPSAKNDFFETSSKEIDIELVLSSVRILNINEKGHSYE